MANDHFVARTYLKRWCNRHKNQPRRAYRKPSGTPFPCWPESVCAEAERYSEKVVTAIHPQQQICGTSHTFRRF
jgi:hypothetical protein